MSKFFDFKKINIKTFLSDYLLLTIGTLLYCMAWDFFFIPNNFASGGLTGACTILQFATGIPVSTSFIIANSFLVILGMMILGNGFGSKTIFCIVLSTIFFKVLPGFEILKCLPDHPLFVDSRLLVAIIAGAVEALGLGIVFSRGGSTGGSDIIALIMNKFWPVSLGKVFLVLDAVIISTILLIPGHNFNDVAYGFVGMITFSIVLDYIILGQTSSVQVMIFSKNTDKVSSFIMNDLERGVTALKATGCYTKTDREVLLVVCKKREVSALTKAIKAIEPDSFVSIVPANSVYGEGFEEIKTGLSRKKKVNPADVKGNME